MIGGVPHRWREIGKNPITGRRYYAPVPETDEGETGNSGEENCLVPTADELPPVDRLTGEKAILTTRPSHFPRGTTFTAWTAEGMGLVDPTEEEKWSHGRGGERK